MFFIEISEHRIQYPYENLVVLVFFVIGSGAAVAQPYPIKSIRLVVPNAPSGGSDAVARVVAEKISPALGQQIIVENRDGAGGRLAAEFVARANPDGYILLMGTGATLITARALYAKLNFDPIKSFAPVAAVASTAYLLIVHPSVPARNVAQLIAIGKARPASLTYASTGTGSPAHLAAEYLQALSGIRIVHVPYRGSAPGTLSVMQGESDLMFGNLIAVLPHIASGRLRVIGISSSKRSAIAPEIPTIADSGLPGFDVEQFYGVVAPVGTPALIIKRLYDAIAAHIPTPEGKRLLESQGTDVAIRSPEQLRQKIKTETEKWTAIVRHAGIQPE